MRLREIDDYPKQYDGAIAHPDVVEFYRRYSDESSKNFRVLDDGHKDFISAVRLDFEADNGWRPTPAILELVRKFIDLSKYYEGII